MVAAFLYAGEGFFEGVGPEPPDALFHAHGSVMNGSLSGKACFRRSRRKKRFRESLRHCLQMRSARSRCPSRPRTAQAVFSAVNAWPCLQCSLAFLVFLVMASSI